ncbi:hypothetical protein Tco_0027577 [Tanacetum coccineum]
MQYSSPSTLELQQEATVASLYGSHETSCLLYCYHYQLLLTFNEGVDMAKEADLRLARMINNVSVKLSAVIEEYQLFAQELEASPGWVVNKDRSIEYLQELVQRDEEMVQMLQALEREVEERAGEKMLFIEKLKGNVPF